MAGLVYVGMAPTGTDPTNSVVNRAEVDALVAVITPSQASVTGQGAAQLYDATLNPTGVFATKTYIDAQAATFNIPPAIGTGTYYAGQDTLNIPNSFVPPTVAAAATAGIANGVATLDASKKIPLSQMPNTGQGYMLNIGAAAPTSNATWPSSTGDTTPINIANWNHGIANWSFRPMVFLTAYIGTVWEQPIVQVYLNNTTTQPSWATASTSGILVAEGVGRYLYNDVHPVYVVPVPDALSETPSTLSTSFNVWLSVWMYGLQGRVQAAVAGVVAPSITMGGAPIATSAAYLVRGAQ
jgi:hypothetical protein